MRKMSKRSLQILVVVLSIILIFLSATAGVMAKYVTEKTFTGSVTIKADLGNIAVQEHKAVRQNDGSYVLGTEVVTENAYTLIPGLDVPKDPFVTVTNKSSIPVYVFLKIETDTLPNTVTYQLESCWKTVDGYAGVYVYSDDNGPIAVKADCTISVLQNDTVYVSQDLKGSISGSVTLSFSASMGQTAAGADASAVYTALFNNP